jgi:hypothetical protein
MPLLERAVGVLGRTRRLTHVDVGGNKRLFLGDDESGS